MTYCEVCGKDEREFPTIFRGTGRCSVICQKADVEPTCHNPQHVREGHHLTSSCTAPETVRSEPSCAT